MMPGLPDSSSLQLQAWLDGKIDAEDLRYDLIDTLTSCRAVIACSMHKTAKGADPKAVPEDTIRFEISFFKVIIPDHLFCRRLMGEAGEYSEPGHVDEACEILLKAAGKECTTLAKSFSSLLQAPVTTGEKEKSDGS
jgi:hypothetical protein